MKFKEFLILLSCSFYLIDSAEMDLDLQAVQNFLCGSRFCGDEVHFLGLSVDCQLMIMENLNFYDLLSIAQTNTYLSILANDVFRRRHRADALLITNRNDQSYDQSVSLKPPHLEVANYDILKTILRVFGGQFRNIEVVHHHIKLDQRNKIHSLIAKYCSDSLTSITLNNGENKVMPGFPTPLKNVEHVLISGTVGIIGKTNLTLNEMFPGLRKLSLDYTSFIFANKLNVHFPLLESVDVMFKEDNGRWDHFSVFNAKISTVLENLFKKNSQIRSLTFTKFNSFDYIKLAADLPNLEEFNAVSKGLRDEYTGDVMRFETLKKFRINLGTFDFSNFVSFDNVEELDLICSSTESIDYNLHDINAIKYKHFTEAPGLHDARILKMTQKAKSLKQFSIISLSEVRLETIEQLIQEHGDLSKLRLVMTSDTLYNQLEQKFEKDWHMERDDPTFLMEKRKQ